MVYFARIGEDGPIKIGYSCDVNRRLVELEKHYRSPMLLLHVMEGDGNTEQEIHDRFSHLRIETRFPRRGMNPEQFRPGSDLMEFIGKPHLSSPNPDAIEAVEDAPLPSTGPLIRVDKGIVCKLRLIAKHRNSTIADLISPILKGPVDRMFLEVMKEIERGTK